MENSPNLLTVSDFIALCNQTLDYAFPSIGIEGEVASFKVNQNKYVFFDLKDSTGSIGCFMTVWQLRQPIEDGMKVVVTATPKLTQWGKFSLTVRAIRPSGEGSLKKSFDLLQAKLEAEGLFRPERKRRLPLVPRSIAVISSTQAAGYADFIKILNDRWAGLEVDVAHVQVQGLEAPDQMIRALRYFNSRPELPEVIVMIRGGGSADDLSAFNDELLVREIAASRAPTLVGVGHETDVSLADLVADVRAATPSNAAQLVVPDRREILHRTTEKLSYMSIRLKGLIDGSSRDVRSSVHGCVDAIQRQYERRMHEVESRKRILAELDPIRVLGRGYAIIRGDLTVGQTVLIEKSSTVATAHITKVSSKEAA